MDTDKHRLDKLAVFSGVGFPEAAYLHKKIPKKQFLESGELVVSDKQLFRENVKNVYWEYTLKSSTCPVLPYRNNEREYLEVAILQIELASQKRHKRIAEIVHRLIPYPLMIGFYIQQEEEPQMDTDTHGFKNASICAHLCSSVVSNDFALSIAPKRFSQAEHGAFVAERFFTTGWMSSEALNDREAAFIQSLAWSNMPLQNYGSLYNAWIDRFTGYECSVLSGTFAIGNAGDRLERLTHCREIESKISALRGQLKKAAFNRQVELNTQIKQMERELAGMVETL